MGYANTAKKPPPDRDRLTAGAKKVFDRKEHVLTARPKAFPVKAQSLKVLNLLVFSRFSSGKPCALFPQALYANRRST